MSDAVINQLKRLETFTFRDDAGVLVTTAVNGDFTKTVIANGAASAVACTVTQIGSTGRYSPSLTPDVVGDWTVIVEWTADPTFAWSYAVRVETAAQADPAAALSAGGVTVVSPVDALTGDVTVYQGTDQVAANSRQLAWSDGSWPVLTGATIAFQAEHTINRTITTSATGAVDVATGADKRVSVQLAHADTDALAHGEWDFQVFATIAGVVTPLVVGTMTVVRKVGP